MGTVIAIIVIVLVVLFILSKSINSISKSVQKMQGLDRCVACRRRLKAVNGVYAKKCSKCGTNQPTDFEREMGKTKLQLQSGELGILTGTMKAEQVKGRLVLTNVRLYFEPKGGSSATWLLEDLKKVVNFTDVAGFAIDLRDGSGTRFFGGSKSQWYEKVLAAANAPLINGRRIRKDGVPSPSAAESAPQMQPAAPAQPTILPPPPGTEAGWLSDPTGNYESRYWDGARWTEHVFKSGNQAVDFV